MAQRRGTREVKFSNLDKVMFPGTGFTKGEMIRYYVDVSEWMLPHLRDRPITMVRFPDGVEGGSFFEKNAPRFTPPWIQRFQVPRRRHEGDIDYILVNDAETLAWCANLASIELHPFLHRVPKIDQPTHIAFDLDPGEGADLLTCASVAFRLRELLSGLGLECFAKVSGSKGLQVYVPLNTPVTYEATSPFAHAVADLFAGNYPDLVVSNMLKNLRRKKVLVDWSQNSISKTTVAVYSLRAKQTEPFVSMPVEWGELERACKRRKPDALFFTPEAAVKRLRKLGDLFEPVLKLRQKLPQEFMRASGERQTEDTGRSTAGERKELAAYRAKRDFSKTSEPRSSGGRHSPKDRQQFVIQKHAATNLHYDFRLEMDGTLKSWAVPKGLPYELGVKRSAFHVEDHPLDYMRFEGTIPKGQYGGGTVMVWDIGAYELLGGSVEEGSLKFILHGKKLKGEWHMFKIRSERGKDVWLIAKSKEAMKPLTPRQEDSSVLTRRSMAAIGRDPKGKVWNS